MNHDSPARKSVSWGPVCAAAGWLVAVLSVVLWVTRSAGSDEPPPAFQRLSEEVASLSNAVLRLRDDLLEIKEHIRSDHDSAARGSPGAVGAPGTMDLASLRPEDRLLLERMWIPLIREAIRREDQAVFVRDKAVIVSALQKSLASAQESLASAQQRGDLSASTFAEAEIQSVEERIRRVEGAQSLGALRLVLEEEHLNRTLSEAKGD